MSIWYNHVRVNIAKNNLAANFALIRSRAANPVPIIKSDAYGHGLKEVARIYWQAGARTMAAGTVGECAVLKDVLPAVQAVSLLGPVDEADYALACRLGILSFVGTQEQLVRLEESGRRLGLPVPVALKFDTGMARLGFDAGQAAVLADVLHGLEHIRPVWACSHLATADDPGQEDYVREQGERFMSILGALSARGVKVLGSLANSGAILGYPELHHDVQRPGISLYGCNPFYQTAWADRGLGLHQAMTVTAPVVQVRSLTIGQTVSYGRTFTADKPMRIAIVAAGYADNYSRGLSGTGQMLVLGRRSRILGRVCMQLTAVDVSHLSQVQPGDEAVLLGGTGSEAITAEEVAHWWGTIPYEVFCLMGQNPRQYS